MQYTVGFKSNGKSDHVTLDGADALAAALRVREERPDAMITYVRRQNRRGDSRHPGHGLDERAAAPIG
jgi:hypothetical protein